jgi:hypothetical protein
MIKGMARSPKQIAQEIDAYLTRVGEKAVVDTPSGTPKQRFSRIQTKFAAIEKAADMTDLRKRFKIGPAMEKRMEEMAEAGSLLADDVTRRRFRGWRRDLARWRRDLGRLGGVI